MSDGHDSSVVTPFPLAMVICDFVYRDPYTSKYTLIGTFSTVTGRQFPLIHPHFFVYVSLTGGRGRIPIRLELIEAEADDESEPIMALTGGIDGSEDPRTVHEIAFACPNVPFPKEGEYRISLYANNEFMVERRILAFNPDRGN